MRDGRLQIGDNANTVSSGEFTIQKLSAIKDKWDPKHGLLRHSGINADRMIAKEGRLCRNTGQAASDSGPSPNSDNQNRGDHDKPYPSFPILAKGKGVLR